MSIFGDIGHFLGNAVKVAAKPLELTGKALQTVGGAVSGAISKIPVIGKPFAAAFSLGFTVAFGPAMAVSQIIDGKRVDQAIVGQLKTELQDIKEVAPYVETVLSFVPGIGTGISAAIAGGLALASGQPITAAIEAGLTAAIPGGPIAKAAFDVAKAGVNMAISGKKVTWEALGSAGLQAIGDLASLPAAAKNALAGALDTAGQLAKGAKIDVAIGDGLADTAATAIGKAGANALKIGIAVAHASFLQKAQVNEIQAPATKNKLMTAGQVKIVTDPIALAAKKHVTNASLNGFYIGLGAMATQIDTNQLVTLRNSLDAASQQGFDHALALHIGRVANPSPITKGVTSPAAQASYFTTLGMQGAHPQVKANIMTNIVQSSPVAKIGASVAVKQIQMQRGGILAEFWNWLKHVL